MDLSLTTATFSSAAALVDLLLDVPLLASREGFVDDALSFVLGELGVVQLVGWVSVPLLFGPVFTGDGSTSCYYTCDKRDFSSSFKSFCGYTACLFCALMRAGNVRLTTRLPLAALRGVDSR